MSCTERTPGVCVGGDPLLCEPPEIAMDCAILAECVDFIPMPSFYLDLTIYVGLNINFDNSSSSYQVETLISGVDTHGVYYYDSSEGFEGLVLSLELAGFPSDEKFTVFSRYKQDGLVGPWAAAVFSNGIVVQSPALMFVTQENSMYLGLI